MLWASAASYFDSPLGSWRLPAAIVYAVVVLALLVISKARWLGLAGCLIASAFVLAWWLWLKPSNDRARHPDVAQTAWAEASAPRLFMTSIMTSVSEPPIWKPTLPPSIIAAVGADHPVPEGRRHKMKPLPYWPPTINAAFFIPGTTTIQAELSSSSCGMPLSAAWAGVALRNLCGSVLVGRLLFFLDEPRRDLSGHAD